MTEVERSYERFTESDLDHLVRVALVTLGEIFERAPVAGLYRDRLVLLALCQGAARHRLDGQNGIKDIDVWAFFRAGPAKPFPVRSVWNADFGPSHLGRSPDDKGYTGRRIDIMGRAIDIADGEAPENALQRWLEHGPTSAWHLAQSPVFGLFPGKVFNRQIWPR
jgi:hypothetical protein